MDYIKAVRTMRTEMNVHPAKKTSMIIETADAAPFQNAQVYLAKFAFATDVTFTEKYEAAPTAWYRCPPMPPAASSP